MKTLLIIFALTASAFAELPDKPQYGTPKSFWIVSGVYAGAIVADGITTHQNQMHGSRETNAWLYGQHPSNARFFATNAAIASGRIYLSRKLINSHRKGVRLIGWGMMYYGIEDHTRCAIQNSQLGPARGFVFTPTPIAGGVHGGPIMGGSL